MPGCQIFNKDGIATYPSDSECGTLRHIQSIHYGPRVGPVDLKPSGQCFVGVFGGCHVLHTWPYRLKHADKVHTKLDMLLRAWIPKHIHADLYLHNVKTGNR